MTVEKNRIKHVSWEIKHLKMIIFETTATYDDIANLPLIFSQSDHQFCNHPGSTCKLIRFYVLRKQLKK